MSLLFDHRSLYFLVNRRLTHYPQLDWSASSLWTMTSDKSLRHARCWLYGADCFCSAEFCSSYFLLPYPARDRTSASAVCHSSANALVVYIAHHSINFFPGFDFQPLTATMGDVTERTFIMVKPDGVQRGLVGKIIKRFESKGFKLVGLKFVWVSGWQSRAVAILVLWRSRHLLLPVLESPCIQGHESLLTLSWMWAIRMSAIAVLLFV